MLPSLVIDGAIKPIIISGIQNPINCPTMYLTVTIILSSATETALVSFLFRKSPTTIPITSASNSLKGRLFKIPFFFISKSS